MKPIVVSDVLAVGEVPSSEQLDILAKAGFKSVINNQPDGEVARFASSDAMGADAKRLGLGYIYAPIETRHPSHYELALFRQALKDLPAPIYAFCYSGARSAAAAAFVLAGQNEPDAIVRDFAEAGFDISSLKPWLDDERKQRAPIGNGTAHATGKEHATPVAKNETGASAVATANGNGSNGARPVAVKAAEVQGIVVHARAAGFSGFAV